MMLNIKRKQEREFNFIITFTRDKYNHICSITFGTNISLFCSETLEPGSYKRKL